MAHILVVSESDDQRLLLQRFLDAPDLEVGAARSGKAGLRMVARQDFDLILMALVMDEMSSREMCERLRAMPRCAAIPIILITEDQRAPGAGDEQLGMVDYVSWPADPEVVLSRVRSLLRVRETYRVLEHENARLTDLLRRSTSITDGLRRRLHGVEELSRLRDDERPLCLVLGAEGQLFDFNLAVREHCPRVQPGKTLREQADPLLLRVAAVLAQHPTSMTLSRQLVQVRDRTYLLHSDPGNQPRLRLVVLRSITSWQEMSEQLQSEDEFDLEAAVVDFQEQLHSGYRISGFVSSSPATRELASQVERLRMTRSTVLINGETGCGKELIARALHFDGPFGGRPFIPIHCGAISPELIESELFGYERGAFTGATQRKEGLFKAADGGTIFLDEIAETSIDLQVKLLRVLQLGEIRPVGATNAELVDVRILAATNQDLGRMVEEGRFREDLYYRLDVVNLHVVPLRQRPEDVAPLVHHFIHRFNRVYKDRQVRSVTRAAMSLLQSYSWPGNVRELENVIDRAFALGSHEVLSEDDLPSQVMEGARPRTLAVPVVEQDAEEPSGSVINLRERRRHKDRERIIRAIDACDGDKSAAAKRLGMVRSTLYRRLRDYGIDA